MKLRPTPLVLMILSILFAVEAVDKKPKNLSYLIMTQKVQMDTPENHEYLRGRALPDEELARQFEALGFKCREVAMFSPKLTMDYLKKFNVVVLGAGGEGQQRAVFSQIADRNMETVLEYVRQGGGLLVLRNPGWQMGKDIEEYNRWLKPSGIEILPEQIVDPGSLITLDSKGKLYWTNNIIAHPVTEGVNGLFYPATITAGYQRYTDFSSPVKVDENWKVLAFGGPNAKSLHFPKSGEDQTPRPGAFEQSPPFLAVRDYGEGRIAVMPVASSCYWHDAYHFFWDQLPMKGDYRGLKGDGAKLMTNLLSWLASPSGGRFGNYQPVATPEKEAELGFKKINWDTMKLTGLVRRKHCFTGLIGPRSELSGGQGSPEEFIEEAKKAGYDFIGFAEHLEHMNEENFTKLKKICSSSCTKTFKAYPGLRYLDDSGNVWITFSDKLSWPDEGWFSKKHKGRIAVNNPLARGCKWPPVIMAHPNRNPEPPWAQGNFNSMAVYTYDKEGKLIDDATNWYFRLLKNSFSMYPVVINLIDNPDQVAKTRGPKFQTMVRWHDGDIIQAMSGSGGSPIHEGKHDWNFGVFVSQGPVFDDFQIVNWGTADLAIPGNDRFRMHLKASDPNGLREVELFDGDRRLLRRFLPKGETDFDKTIDFFHDRQYRFVAVLSDEKGRQALSWPLRTVVQENSFPRCSDNFNTMPRGKWWGPPKTANNIRGFEDYLIRRNFTYFGLLKLDNLTETTRPAVEYHPLMVSRFGTVVDAISDYHYAPTAKANPDATDKPELAEKNQYVSGGTRYTYFTCRQDNSLIELVEGRYKALKDFTSSSATIFSTGGWPKTYDVAATLKNGDFLAGKLTRDQREYKGDLLENGFAVLFPNRFLGSLSAIPLQNDLFFKALTRKDLADSRLFLYLRPDKTSYKAGESIDFKYLGVISRIDASPDNMFIYDIIDKMGLRRKTAYQVIPSQGEVLGSRFILRLRADDYGFSGTFSQAKLPLDLPVEIRGLNPNWDAGIFYRGKNTLMISHWEVNEFSERNEARKPRIVENEIQHFPVDAEGTGYLQVDTETTPKNVYIGNLLVCDVPDIRLTLVDHRPGKAVFTAHNPTDKTIVCKIKPGRGFDLFGDFEKQITIPPGSSVETRIGSGQASK